MKAKNIPNLIPEKKKIGRNVVKLIKINGQDSGVAANYNFNQASSLIGEKELVLDVNAVKQVLHDKGFYKFIVEDRIIDALSQNLSKLLVVKK